MRCLLGCLAAMLPTLACAEPNGAAWRTAPDPLGATLAVEAPTLVALKSLVPAAGLSVRRVGFEAPGDTPGVDYVYAATACAAPDDGLQVQSSVAAGCWVAPAALGGEVAISVWGGSATATGAQNTLAFRRALLAGVRPRFGPGAYRMSAGRIAVTVPPSRSGTGFSGAGKGLTSLVWPAAGGGVDIMIDLRGLDDHHRTTEVRVSDLSALAGDVAASDFLHVSTLNDASGADAPSNSYPIGSTIERVACRGSDGVRVTNAWGACVRLSGLSNVAVRDMDVFGPAGHAGHGLLLEGGYSGPGPGQNTYGIVANISGSSFWGTGIAIGYGTYVQGVTAVQVNVTDGLYGIVGLAGAHDLNQLAVSNSQFQTLNGAIYTPTAVHGVQLTGNLFFSQPGQCDVNLEKNSFFTVTGNRFEAYAAATPGYSAVTSNTRAVCVGETVGKVPVGAISGNIFTGYTLGIDLSAASSNVVVGASNAFAATATRVRDLGFGNTVADFRKVVEDSALVVLGPGGAFTIPLPFRSSSMTGAAASQGSARFTMADTSAIAPGQYVSGPNIPDGTYVTAVAANTRTFSVSAPVTGTVPASQVLGLVTPVFSSPPIVTATNGDAATRVGIPMIRADQTTNLAIVGIVQGAASGDRVRINYRAVGY